MANLAPDRITVPLDDSAAATSAALLVAASLARCGDFAIEIVTVVRPGLAGRLEAEGRRWRSAAAAAGAPHSTWTILDDGTTDVGSYALWSGSFLLSTSTGTHTFRQTLPIAGGHVPVVVSGPRARTGPALDLRRVVVGVDGSPAGDHVVDVAADVARRTGADLVLVEVFAPGSHSDDVPESAYVRRIAARLHTPGFDTLHDRHPADGILRFVGTGEQTIIAVGTPVPRHGRAHGGVPGAVVRHAPCPVLIVPAGRLAQGV